MADVVRRGRISKSTENAQKMNSRKLAALIPLTEPGWLLRIDLKYMYVGREPRENMSRTIRVPKTITFHQLHGILVRVFGWNSSAREGTSWGSDEQYKYDLWDERIVKPRHYGIPESPRETLTADAPGYRAPGTGYWHSSKIRTLAQIFTGSGSLWPELPFSIEYQLYLIEAEDEVEDQRARPEGDGHSDVPSDDGDEFDDCFMSCWDYTIHFLGETTSTLTSRPGQEVFCTEGTGYTRVSDLNRHCPAFQLDQHSDFSLDRINRVLEAWCHKFRSQRGVADEDVEEALAEE